MKRRRRRRRAKPHEVQLTRVARPVTVPHATFSSATLQSPMPLSHEPDFRTRVSVQSHVIYVQHNIPDRLGAS